MSKSKPSMKYFYIWDLKNNPIGIYTQIGKEDFYLVKVKNGCLHHKSEYYSNSSTIPNTKENFKHLKKEYNLKGLKYKHIKELSTISMKKFNKGLYQGGFHINHKYYLEVI